MSRRKKPYVKKSFESVGTSSDTSANIYESMLLSNAWLDLSASQKALYITCKAQYYAEKHKPDNDNLTFTMNKYKWAEKYKLYSSNNSRGFQRDMSALIEHGFIACVESGATTRKKSVYKFSDKWQSYGKPEFDISPDEMNMTLLNALHKKTSHMVNL